MKPFAQAGDVSGVINPGVSWSFAGLIKNKYIINAYAKGFCMAITTVGTLPPPVRLHFQDTMLAIKVPGLIHTSAATRVNMPKQSGNFSRHQRMNKLPVQLAPLPDNGLDPAAMDLTAVNIDVKLQKYGGYVIINEQVILTSQCPVLNQTVKLLAINMRETEDVLVRNMLASTSSYINCVQGTNGSVPTEITGADIADIVATLVDNDATMITDSIEGENKFATAPVRAAFIAMCSTKLIPSLQQCDGFQPVAQYASANTQMRNEWGAVENARFLVSSLGSFVEKASSTGTTVYNFFVSALQAYGITYQDGYSMQLVQRPPQYSTALATNSTLGWKAMMGNAIYNDQWLIAGRCTL